MSEVSSESVMLSGKEILTLLPQQEPFRFVDDILEVDEDHIVASYRFRPESEFYKGHFSRKPCYARSDSSRVTSTGGCGCSGYISFCIRGGFERGDRQDSSFCRC